jgi:prepilin-type N-terminal cleavage/methylation domain-containing protein
MRRAGFTLIEIMIVTIILGILVLIALPRVNRIREKALIVSMVSELRALHWSQELYYAHKLEYATDVSQLGDFQPTKAITIDLRSGGKRGWAAEAAREDTPVRCALFVGSLLETDAFVRNTEEETIKCTDGTSAGLEGQSRARRAPEQPTEPQ